MVRRLLILFIFVNQHLGLTAQAELFTAGVYIVTQQALDEAPERYANFLLLILDKMQTVKVPPVEDWDNCNIRYRVGPANRNSSIELIPNTLKLTLVDGYQLKVFAQTKVSIPAATKISKCFRLLFWCVSMKVCDEIAYYNAMLSISLTLEVKWDVTSKQLKIDVQNLSIPPTTPDIQGCHPSGIVDFFVDWHRILNEKVQGAVNDYVTDFEKSFSMPPTIKLTEGLYTNYTVQDIYWRAGDSATIVANALLFGEINGQNVTYEPDQQKAHLPIALEGFPRTDSTDSQSHLLQASRLSSIFLTGLVWYADKTGQLFYHSNATVLDSFLNITMFISPPRIDIPRNGTINVTISNGSFNAMCRPVESLHPHELIKILYKDLQGSGALMYTNDSSPGVILQLVDLIFDYMTLQPVEPKLPLPSSLEYGIVKNAINQSKPLINTFLANNPLILPGNIKPYVAHPVIEVFEGVPLVTVGYMQISSYCSCKQSSDQFVLCGQYLCPSRKLTDATRKLDPISDVLEQERTEEWEDTSFLTVAVYDNGNCNVVNSTVGLYNVKLSGGNCIKTDQFSGYRYKLRSQHGPLHWNCVDSNCLKCQIIVNVISTNYCYGQSDFSLSVGSVCQQDEQVTKSSLFIQQYTTQGSQNCSDDLLVDNATGFAILDWQPSAQGNCIPYSGSFSEITPFDQQKHFNVSLFCSDESCSNCNITETNVVTDQCFQSYYKLRASPRRCRVPLPWLPIAIVTVFTVFLIALLPVDLFFFRFRGCKWCYRVVRHAFSILGLFIKTDLPEFVCRSAQKVFHLVKRSSFLIRACVNENLGFRREYNVEDVFQIFLCFLSFAVVMWQRYVWIYNDTIFLLFTGNITGKFNIPEKFVDTKNVEEYFNNWELVISRSMEFSSACLWMPFFAYVVLIRSSFNCRTFSRILAITVCLICSLVVPLLPLFVQDFRALINLGDGNVTGINNPKIYHYVEMGLQESFTGLVSACFAGLVMNLFQGLNAGMFLAVLLHEMIYKPVKGESIIIHQMYNLISFGTVLQVFFSIHPVIVWTQYSSTHASFFLFNTFLWILPCLSWILKTVLSSIFQSYFPSSRFTTPTVFIFITCYVIATNRVIETQKTYYNDNQIEDFVIAQLVNTIVLILSITYMFLSIGHHDESYHFALRRGCLKVQNNDINRNGFRCLANAEEVRESNQEPPPTPEVPDDDLLEEVNLENIPNAENPENAQNESESKVQFHFKVCNVTCRCFSTDVPVQYLLKFFSLGLNWLFETKEHGDPNEYGLKIEKRRLFLSIGCLAFSYVTYENIMYELKFDAQEQIQKALDSFGLNLTWPSNGTIFDNAFSVYNDANLRQTYVLAIASTLFWLSFLSDMISYFSQSKWKLRFLLFSRLFGIFGGLCIFASIAILAEPNYMAATNFAQLCPDCGTQFNAAVKTGTEFIVGLFIGILFTIKLSPVLFTVAPALVRTSVLILIHPRFEDQKFSQWDDNFVDLPTLNRINRVRITLLKGVCVAGGISAMPLTLLAIGILVQYEQNESTVITLIALFWSAPFISLLIFLSLHSITGKSGFLLAAYFVYTITYFAFLIWLICYCLSLYGQLSIITEQLKTFIFYCELISEIFLTNIALSDLLYISLF